MGGPSSKPRRNPILGAAVLKALLLRRSAETARQTSALYEGVLRDLGLSDAEVEAYLADHQGEVEQAIRSHGRRGE